MERRCSCRLTQRERDEGFVLSRPQYTVREGPQRLEGVLRRSDLRCTHRVSPWPLPHDRHRTQLRSHSPQTSRTSLRRKHFTTRHSSSTICFRSLRILTFSCICRGLAVRFRHCRDIEPSQVIACDRLAHNSEAYGKDVPWNITSISFLSYPPSSDDSSRPPKPVSHGQEHQQAQQLSKVGDDKTSTPLSKQI
jgi:hypothetical protein